MNVRGSRKTGHKNKLWGNLRSFKSVRYTQCYSLIVCWWKLYFYKSLWDRLLDGTNMNVGDITLKYEIIETNPCCSTNSLLSPAICINGCSHNGTCFRPNSCICTPFWTGSTCSTGKKKKIKRTNIHFSVLYEYTVRSFSKSWCFFKIITLKWTRQIELDLVTTRFGSFRQM